MDNNIESYEAELLALSLNFPQRNTVRRVVSEMKYASKEKRLHFIQYSKCSIKTSKGYRKEL
jgi:hypothetical protein